MPPCFTKRGPRADHEAAVLTSLDHPGIVRCIGYSAGELQLEHLDGTSLSGSRLPVGETAALANGLLETLAYLHAQAWVHNDICPANIMLTERGPVLIDFETATRLGDPEPHLLGTLDYMAPERFSGEAPTAASDLYSLGITLFECLSGRLPFDPGSDEEVAAAHHLHLFHPLENFCPGLPADLLALVCRLTSRQPYDRVGQPPT
jgi:serine/threonine-protein kinase